MINLSKIKKAFHENTAYEHIILNDLYIDIKDGEKILIEGKNGAGKTSLLKIIGLLDKNYRGDYILDGKNIAEVSSKTISTLRNEKFGFVFQDYKLLEDENVYYNILIPLLYSKKIKRNMREKRIVELASIFELEGLLKEKVYNLSGGEKQRVAILRAIVNKPQVLILDEPTNALNPVLKEKILSYLMENFKENTIILVSHESNISSLKNFIKYRLYDGKLLTVN